MIEKLEKKISYSRSQLIREAVEDWLKKKEKELLEEKYKEYYANKDNWKKQRKLAEQMWRTAKENWPRY